LALLKNPEKMARIAALYAQINAVYEADRQHYKALCCDLCGEPQCVKEVLGFPHNPPNLCSRKHGKGWNSAYQRSFSYGDVKLNFAKWLANTIVKETTKLEYT
jgi:hypothetical protein